MSDSSRDPMEFVKRIVSLPGGITAADYRDLRILLGHGFEPKAYGRTQGRTSFRELKKEINLVPFNSPAPMEGDIILGKNSGGITRYHSDNAPRHLLGLGMTGVGKSVFLVMLLLQYIFIAAGLWIFDFVKRELRGFKRLAEQLGFSPIVCRYEWLRINILDPQGLDPAQYANICAEFITVSLGLPAVAKHILKICIVRLYERFGLFNDSHAAPPILPELIEEVMNFVGNAAAKQAILIRLEALYVNNKNIFNVRQGFPIRRLAKMIIIWEFDSIETQYQVLFITYLISMLFAIRVAEPSDELLIAAIDEAVKLYSKLAEAANEGPTYISTMTSVIRKKRIGLFVFNQTKHDLCNSILANSAIKVMFQLGTAEDYDGFGRTIALDSQQIRYAKVGLDVGMQIIKMNVGWKEPFINYSPLIHIPEDVSDIEARASAQTLLDMVPAPTTPVLYLPASSGDTVNESDAEKLTQDEDDLLNHVRKHPEITAATEHFRLAGLGTKRGTAAKKSLIKKDLLKETPVESGRRGGASLYLDTTEEDGGRLGGGVHGHLRKNASNYHLRQHCIVEPEKNYRLGDKWVFVDLAVTWPDGKTEAIEIETEDSEHVIENIIKNLALDFEVISLLTPNRKVRDAIKERVMKAIDKESLGRIRFPSISLYE